MKSFHVSAGEEMDPENERGQKDGQQNQQKGGNQQRQGGQQQRGGSQGGNQRPPQNQQRQGQPPRNQQQNNAPKDPLEGMRKWMFKQATLYGYNDEAHQALTREQFPNLKSRKDLDKLQIQTLVQIMKDRPKPKVGSDDDIAQAGQETSQFLCL